MDAAIREAMNPIDIETASGEFLDQYLAQWASFTRMLVKLPLSQRIADLFTGKRRFTASGLLLPRAYREETDAEYRARLLASSMILNPP
jgi:hypothetical protein